jgi:hypothetical protein
VNTSFPSKLIEIIGILSQATNKYKRESTFFSLIMIELEGSVFNERITPNDEIIK